MNFLNKYILIIFTVMFYSFSYGMKRPATTMDPFLHIRDKITSEFLQRGPTFSHLKELLLQKAVKESRTFSKLSSSMQANAFIINSMAIDSNSKFLAVGAKFYNLITLIDLSSKTESIVYYDKTLKPESDPFSRVEFEKGAAHVGFIDNHLMYNNDTNNTLDLYDPQTKQNIRTITQYKTITSMATNQKDYAAAIDDGTLLINGDKINQPKLIHKLVFSKNIIAGGEERPFSAYIYNTENNQLSKIEKPMSYYAIYSMSLNSDANMIGIGNRIFDINSKSVINKDEKIKDTIYANAFHPNNKIFVYSTAKNEIIFYNIETNEKSIINPLKEEKTEVITHILFSPNGELFIVGLTNGKIKLFDVSNLNEAMSFIAKLKIKPMEFIQYLTTKNPQDQLSNEGVEFLFLSLIDDAIENRTVLDLCDENNKWLKMAYDKLKPFVKTAIKKYVKIQEGSYCIIQ